MNSLTVSLPTLKTRSFNFLKIIWFLTCFNLILVFCFTIIQMSLYAQEVFLVKNYEKKITILKEENKKLEVEFSKLNSLSNLQEYLKNFEKAKNVKYIKITGSSIAEK